MSQIVRQTNARFIQQAKNKAESRFNDNAGLKDGPNPVTNINELWDASSGEFPANSEEGFQYKVGVAGVVAGRYYKVGEHIIARKTSASTLDPLDWDIPPSDAVIKSLDFTATAGQTTFSMPAMFVPESVKFFFDGYALSYGSRLTTSVYDISLPNLGFELEAGDIVTFSYIEKS